MIKLGLKNSLKERVIAPFWAFRGTDSHGGRQVTFRDFLKTRPDGGDVLKNSDTGAPIGMAELFMDMGKDPYNTTFNELAERDDDFRYLFGPMIEDAFIKGFAELRPGVQALWQALCFGTGIPTTRDSLARTWLKFNGLPTETIEGENFPEATITNGQELVSWSKKGVTLRSSYEYLRANPIPVVEAWIAEVGRMYQHVENCAAVKTLVMGDVKSGGNATPIIGVADTSTGFQYQDFLTAWSRGDYIGEQWWDMVSGETSGNEVAMIDEFKLRYYGTPIIPIVNRPEPSAMDRYINIEVPDNQVLLLDDSHALRQRVFIPINVRQSDKPENWTSGVTIGYSSAFERIGDKACLIMDKTLKFSEHGFPDWFVVGGSRPYTEIG